MLHGEMYADMGLQKLAEKALHESAHEREHAQAIIQRILFLEGKPDLSKREALQIGSTVPDMLKSDLAVEYKVTRELKKPLPSASRRKTMSAVKCWLSSWMIPKWIMPISWKNSCG
jgi:bacterioferritin